MTVAALAPAVAYIEDGTSLDFAVPYKFRKNTLIVSRTVDGVTTTLIPDVDYTVLGGLAPEFTGKVTLAASIAGAGLAIVRSTPITQDLDFDTGDTFPAESHEAALDKLTMIAQEQKGSFDSVAGRVVYVPVGESSITLPPIAARANKIATYDAAGNPIAADHVGQADHANTADYATNAGHAATADFATIAGSGQADTAKKWTTPRTLYFDDATTEVQGLIAGVDGSGDHHGGVLGLVEPRVKVSETFDVKTPAGAGKWPRLNAGGSLDASLINMPSALTYKGTRDFAAPPPASPALGDLYIASVNGTVNAGYGPPAAGQAVKAGDWLGLNAYGEWQLIPPGSIQEAPADGKTYGRMNLLWSASYRVDSVAIGAALRPGSAVLQVAGDASLVGRGADDFLHLGFNGQVNAGNWTAPNAGYMATIRFDAGVNGDLQFWSSSVHVAAGGTATMVFRGNFDRFGGFNVGTLGGEFGTNWVAMFRRDQTTPSNIAVLNNGTGANVAAGLRCITGTSNSFADLSIYDNGGTPLVKETYGSAVQFRFWDFGGYPKVLALRNDGFLGVGRTPHERLDVAGSIVMDSTKFIYTGYDDSQNWLGGVRAGIQFSGGNQYIYFYTSNAPQAWMQNDGKWFMRGNVQVQPSGGGGSQLNGGDSNHSGYVSFLDGGGGRMGYIGFIDSTQSPPFINYSNDSPGGGHHFNNDISLDRSLWAGGFNSSIGGMITCQDRGSTALHTWTTGGIPYNAGAFNYMGTEKGSILCSTTGTTFNTTSDARLKTNIADAADDAGALIDKLRVRQFDWREGGVHVAFGLVAQELAEVWPDAVNPLAAQEDGTQYLGVDKSTLIPLMLAELKALRARVKALEAA